MQALNALKNQLLDLAIRGKLVPQIDGEAGVEQIGKVPEKVPFEIPEKWKWTRLDRIAEIISGRDLPRSEIIETPTGTPYITGASQFDSTGIIANRWTDTPIVISEKNDLLLTVKGTVGKLAINKIGTVHIARQIAAIRPINPSVVLTEYLFICFQSISSLLSKSANGMIPGIGRKDIVNRPIPLPPLKEQQRIVEKLGSLFSKIDVIQKSMDEVSQLSSSLEKQLLQSAISGKLVQQLDEEPEVAQIGQAPEETPFEIPGKWRWIRLDLIAKIVSGRDLSKSEIIETPASTPYITGASQFDSTGIIANRWTDNPVVISEKDDLLLTVKGTVGKIAINKIGKVHIARQIAAIRPINPSVVLTEYLFIYFQNISSLLSKSANGMIPGIGRKDIVNQLIPLPPLGEQKRIVEKLDKLMLEIQKLK